MQLSDSCVGGRERGPAAHRDPQVRRWLAGYGVSLLGDQAFFLASAVGAAAVVGPGGAGLALAAISVPRALLLLVGGAVVDRVGERAVMLVSDGVRCAVILLGALYVAVRGLDLAALLVVGVAFAAVDGFFLPAAGALPTRMVEASELARLNGLRSTVQRLTVAVGGPVAGVTLGWGGVAGAWLVNGLTFVVSFVALAGVRLRPLPAAPPSRPGFLSEVAAGLGYVRRRPQLAVLLVVISLTELAFTGPFSVGVALSGWRPGQIGLITGGFGLGAIGAPLFVAVRGRVPLAVWFRVVAFAAGGACLAGLGATSSVVLAAAASAGLGVVLGVAGTATVTLVQTGLDPAFRGRVMSILTLSSFGTVPVSFSLTGLGVDALGVAGTFAVAGGVLVLAALVTAGSPVRLPARATLGA